MRVRKGSRIEAAAHVLALEEGWADADNRPMPVFEDIGVVAGNTVYRDQERFGKWVRRLDDPYPYEGGEMIEAHKKLLALSMDQYRAIKARESALGELRTAQTKRHTTDLDNLAKARKVREQRENKLTRTVSRKVKMLWKSLPKSQRSVRNITKRLCNPKGRKRSESLGMKRWKYRWMYKKDKKIIEETISFWSMYRYVKVAVKALKPASA